jgi:hypothetical protein
MFQTLLTVLATLEAQLGQLAGQLSLIDWHNNPAHRYLEFYQDTIGGLQREAPDLAQKCKMMRFAINQQPQ